MPYLYVLPGLVLVGLFVLGSVGLTFFVGLTKWPTFEHPQWTGLKNYTELFFNDSTFVICLRNNLYWVLVSLGLIPLAFMLAVLIDEFERAADYFKTLIFTPSRLSLIVV
ncbi:sugar ABC transporter permease [Candidatus Aerophobetes bacterium]|nr:sugar ABC transporter permease [Candidatus Aerophobetes bacterium]